MRAPEALSERSRALWRALHARYELSPDAAELLERGLHAFDLADELLALARVEGLTSPAGRGALSGSRDANMAGLKLLVAVGLQKSEVEPLQRRLGRPPGIRAAPPRRDPPRDPLTGRPLRDGAA